MSNYTPKHSNIPYGYCQCGCGNKTPIANKSRASRGITKGLPHKYCHGHSGSYTSRNPKTNKITYDHESDCFRVKIDEENTALIDSQDVETVSQYIWSQSSGYAVSKKARMHRLILSAPDGVEVDHINGDRLDNRRSNLRLCNRSENARNRRIDKRNTSGFYGVSPCEKGKWRADICYNRKQIPLGRFSNPRHAAMVRDMAAIEMYGEFAKLNLNVVSHKQSKEISDE